MSKLGFPPQWCRWIYRILSTARSSVLVNGSPTFEFQCFKGMRQGDLMRKASSVGAIRGFVLPNDGPTLTHLLYVDDCVIMGEWGHNNIRNVARLLRCIYMVSSLKINLNKSELIGLGMNPADVADMALVLNCKVGDPVCSSWGLVGAKMNRIINWKSVFDTFKARLALWKSSLLSIRGRVTLIKSVLKASRITFFRCSKRQLG
ncbi:uncharacterized protein LOC110893123 [Helianthus annuus]|uniref:uncharacterized protein LOC110893123 n=1 Tax=Helianthus annuus TaxID=4232 RepID=UPI000B8F5A5A|nr:uncharacterized protein LOC110893123 [Helianthus annuus]